MDEHTNNGFSDWESLPFNFNNPISSSSSSSSTSSHNHSPSQIPNHHNHNHDDHLSIFHPSNHEDLPITVTQPQIPPPNSPPNSNSNFDHNSSSSSSAPQKPLFIKWFDFALHLWNSKLISFFTLLRNKGLFSLLLPVAFTTSFLGFLWFLVRRRWRRLRQYGEKESVEHLKLIIKEKDEKIIQLLEQIALMNKVLLTRYRVPVWKA